MVCPLRSPRRRCIRRAGRNRDQRRARAAAQSRRRRARPSRAAGDGALRRVPRVPTRTRPVGHRTRRGGKPRRRPFQTRGGARPGLLRRLRWSGPVGTLRCRIRTHGGPLRPVRRSPTPCTRAHRARHRAGPGECGSLPRAGPLRGIRRSCRRRGRLPPRARSQSERCGSVRRARGRLVRITGPPRRGVRACSSGRTRSIRSSLRTT